MKNKLILILTLILATAIASISEYGIFLLFIKQHAKMLFLVLLLFSILSNFIKTKNQGLKDSIFTFFIILWASFWFVCFEASYIPLYVEGQCLKGEYFNHDKFSLELKKIKYNDTFGFMKYDVNQLFKLKEKYKSLESLHIVRKNENGYFVTNNNGLKFFVPVYEDTNYLSKKCDVL